MLEFLKQSDRQIEYLEHDIKRYRYVRDKDGKRVRDSNSQMVLMPELEVSLDMLIAGGWNFPSNYSPEDEALAKMEVEELYRSLDRLNNRERELIDALFFSNDGRGMSEREYAKLSGIPRKTIAYQKKKILEKLKFD